MPAPKTYPLHASFFFKQRSINKVCGILDLSEAEFDALALNTDQHYRIKEPSEGQKRRTETPQGVLKRVHDRLQTLLYRITVPDYAAALRRDVNYVDNAKSHAGLPHVLKTDIAKFYPSVKRSHVKHFLAKTLQMSPDLAEKLSRIMTVEGFVPTGSPLSQTVSFWSMYPMFDRIAKLAAAEDITFTVWVDDLVFSSKLPVGRRFLSLVTQQLRAAGMTPKYEKTVAYKPNQPKKITGTILNAKGEAKIPNGLRRSIVGLAKQIEGKPEVPQDVRQRLISKISSAQNIESAAFKATKAKAMATTGLAVAKNPPKPPRKKKTYPKLFA